MSRRALLAGLFASLVLLAIGLGIAWTFGTPGGLRAAAGIAERLVPGLRIERPSGTLAGPLQLGRLVHASPQREVLVDDIELDWRPARLLGGLLSVGRLSAERLEIRRRAENEPMPPADLRLPFDLSVERLNIARIVADGIPDIENLETNLTGDGREYRIDRAGFSVRGIDVAAGGRLGAQPPFALNADAGLSGRDGIDAKLSARGSLEELVVLQASSTHRKTTIEGSAGLRPFSAHPLRTASLSARGLDPAAWLDDAPRARIDVDAELAADSGGRLRGTVSAVNRDPGRLDENRVPVVRFAADTSEKNGAADIANLTVEFTRGEASGSGRVDAEGRFALNVQLRGIDPAAFADLPQGSITADVDAAGRWPAQPAVDLRFVARNSRFAGHAVGGRGRLALIENRLSVDAVLRAGDNRVAARGELGKRDGELTLDIEAPRLEQVGLGGALRGKVVASGAFDAPALRWTLASPRLVLPGGEGARNLRTHGRWQPGGTIEAELAIAELEKEGLPPVADLLLRLDGPRARQRLQAGARLGEAAVDLAAAGSPQDDGSWRGRIERLAWRGSHAFHLDAPASLELARDRVAVGGATLLGGDWRARVDEFAWRAGAMRSRGSIDSLPASLLSPALRGTLRLGGDWNLRFGSNAAGRARLFRQRGDLVVDVGGEPVSLGLSDALAQAEFNGRELVLSVRAAGSRAGSLDGRLTAALEANGGAWRLARRTPWRGRFALDTPSIAWLGPLAGGDLLLDGRLRAVADIAGTPAQPAIAGSIAGDGLRVRLPDYGLDLGAGVLRAEATRDRLILRRLELASVATQPPKDPRVPFDRRPGQLQATGEIAFDGSGSIDFTATRLLVSELPDRWIMVSGSGNLGLADERLRVRAAMNVDAAYVEAAPAGRPSLSPDVVIAGRKEPEPRLSFVDVADIVIALGDRFYFNGSGIESRLAGRIRLTGSARQLRAAGSVRTVDGTLTAYGSTLSIERGILNFAGLPDNPGLNVRALRRNLPVEAGVEVSGTLNDPEIRLVSVPDVPDTEKLSWLALGRPPGEALGAQDAGTLLSAAMALRGGGAHEGLLRELGIEEFGIASGTIGAESRFAPTHIAGSFERDGAAEQIATFGRRIASNAVLSYQRSLASAESVLTLTIELSRRLSLVGSVGTDNAIELVYSFAFGGTRRGDAPAINSRRPETRPASRASSPRVRRYRPSHPWSSPDGRHIRRALPRSPRH